MYNGSLSLFLFSFFLAFFFLIFSCIFPQRLGSIWGYSFGTIRSAISPSTCNSNWLKSNRGGRYFG